MPPKMTDKRDQLTSTMIGRKVTGMKNCRTFTLKEKVNTIDRVEGGIYYTR